MMTMGGGLMGSENTSFQEFDDPGEPGECPSPTGVAVYPPQEDETTAGVEIQMREESGTVGFPRESRDRFILALVSTESGMKEGGSILKHLQESFDVGDGAAYSLFGPEGNRRSSPSLFAHPLFKP